MREFLGGRPMTSYPEAWMDRVDGMKLIQGWTDTSIMHFNDLATIGEQLVLTIRLGNWADPTVGEREAERGPRRSATASRSTPRPTARPQVSISLWSRTRDAVDPARPPARQRPDP